MVTKWENAKRRQFIATSPRRLARFSRRVWRGYWQVFGLAGVPDQRDRSFYWPIFPVLEKTSGVWVFDPAYRCGAVPDSHRIPFNVPLGTSPAYEPQDRGLFICCQSKCCGFPIHPGLLAPTDFHFVLLAIRPPQLC
jgi:hypothetical protein